MASLTGEQLKDSYQNLLTIDATIESNPLSGRLENGLGNAITALGIGTDSPSEKLHISGTNSGLRIDGGTSYTNTSTITLSNGRAKIDSEIINATAQGDTAIRLYNRVSGSLAERMQINHFGDISFRDSGASEAFYWDAGTARLGIGNTSPDALLHIGGSIPTSAEALNVRGNAVGTYAVSIEQDNSSGYGVLIDTDGTLVGQPALNVKNSSGSMLYVGSNGHVGIGTSPETTLDVNGAITIRNSPYPSPISGVLKDAFIGSDDGTLKFAINGASNGSYGDMAFLTRKGDSSDAITAMTIDSSGNVLVGTTSTDTSTTSGFTVQPDGQCFASADGQQVVTLSRLTSDGEILRFRRGGTTVGSIGSTSGVISHIILDPRSSLKGAGILGASIDANTGIIQPCDRAGAVADNAINLGSTSNRWKNLYLGGSVYLGGTDSANALDDYEEGTWNPEFGDGTTFVAVSDTYNYYTKIGRQVTANARIVNADKSSFSSGDNIYITLPFVSDGDFYGTIYLRGAQAGFTGLQPVQINNDSDNFVLLGVTMADVIDDSTDYWFTVTYFV